jgi:hypothetical protein
MNGNKISLPTGLDAASLVSSWSISLEMITNVHIDRIRELALTLIKIAAVIRTNYT